MLALGVCFSQPCSSEGRRFAASKSRLNFYWTIVFFHKNEFDEMLCKLDSSEYARSFEQNTALTWSRGAIGFWFVACCAATQLALQLSERH